MTSAKAGFVYFVQAGDGHGAIKIGFASNVPARIATLQTGCPLDLRLLAAIPGTYQTEREIQTHFADVRLRGEWFAPEPGFVAFVERMRQAA